VQHKTDKLLVYILHNTNKTTNAYFCTMLRHFVITILLFSLVFQSLQIVGFTALYELNKKFIAEKLCENRSRPQMHCEGKCCLKKQLAKSAGQQNDNKSPVTKIENLVYQVESFFSINACCHQSLENCFPVTRSNIVKGFYKNIFHPPLS
jgi:hypothetical protein